MRLPPPSRSLLSPKVIGALYRKHLTDCRQERLFLGNVGFLTAFVTVRGITHSIRAGRGPFRNVTPGGRHIHHMTFGILGLLLTGYAWNAQLGIGNDPARRWGSRVSATGYGMASALTLDEFALWLNLQDDYWTKQGRESIDAVVIFGSLLFLALMNQDLVREASQIASGRRDARVLLAHDAARREDTDGVASVGPSQ
ncbi:MAG: hypothetical protein ABSF58_09110 [Solirubrobacteraceae bacterium]|jgi:hypothetical protein